VRDAKCDYPSACNAMETLLIHKDLLHTDLFDSLIEMLEQENVKLHSGPTLNRSVKFAPPLIKELKHEYSDLELTIELIDGVDSAIKHINKYGSNHTDSIVTKNGINSIKEIKLITWF
jgi:delta-1-pyrroline-5-carboxylate synthetase